MQTVILRPMELGVGGVIEYYIKNGRLTVSYNIDSNNTGEVLKLVALSSRKPSNIPLKVDVPLFDGSTASGKKVISASDAAYSGYNLGDIDTFALIFGEKSNIKIASTGFSSLHWNISYQTSRNFMCENNTPVKEAEKILLKIKKRPVSDEEYEKILKYIHQIISKLKPSEVCPLEGYKWYDYDCWEYPIDLSSIKHVIHTEEFIKAYQDSGICVVGIKGINRMAIALKTEGTNPFVNAEDCAVEKNGFWITGILLKKEGQYFERVG